MTLKGTRTCRKCKVAKTLLDFEPYQRKYGIAHRTVCIECVKAERLVFFISCQVCSTTKNREEFPKSRNASLGIERICKKE